MAISFTGFKNVSTVKFVDPRTADDNYMYSLTMQLTDDSDNKDLTTFRKAAARPKSFEYNPLEDNRFVNVQLVKIPEQDSYLCVNGEPLLPQDDTLEMFSVVAKLLKRVRDAVPGTLVVNRDYVCSEEYDNMVLPNNNLRQFLGANYDDIAQDFVLPNVVKSQAGDVFQGLEDIMMDYLA